MARVALITGTSTGIGLSTSILLAKAGFTAVATMRNTAKATALQERASKEGVALEVMPLDVQDDASVKACVDAVLAKHGRIDVLVNNAGAGQLGSVEQVSMKDLQQTMDVNFYGVWRLTQAVLPAMRKAGTGRIISVSSIGGLIGQPFNDAYCAAKFAVEGFMESLAPVAKRLGVDVCLVEPGPVNTEFVATVRGKTEQGPAPDAAYAPMLSAYLGGSAQLFATMGQTGDDVAKVIVQAATEDNPHLRYLTSERVIGLAKTKYVDVTGDAVRDMAGKRLG